MGWTVVFNVSFFYFQIALLLKLSRFGGYYTKKFRDCQTNKGSSCGNLGKIQ